MPSTRDIRRRIKSVKSTAQITKAMQMVASSKMLKAQQGALNFRPFAKMAAELVSHLTTESGDYRHPLMEPREALEHRLLEMRLAGSGQVLIPLRQFRPWHTRGA